MAEPKPEETFKVIDRRHFTEQGDLRQDVVEQEKREEEEAAAKKAATAVAPKTHPKAAANAQGAPKASAPAHGGVILPPGAAEPVPAKAEPAESVESSHAFQMLVDFLTRNAAAMLGGMADPRTGQAFVDLEGAREVIDMLDALRDKTRGNLSKADDDLLIEVLGSLKLTFMEISKAATEAMAKKAGQKK
ncbi:MAG TPA: DUF1844 domain-containing protein [Candidatus Limnocylindria bacterium]|nr:DUF1844 domain-containing protein [Candidatus Limnocylindria bacterium]